MDVTAADGEDFRPLLQFKGTASGQWSACFGDMGHIDDGSPINVPELIGVKFPGKFLDVFLWVFLLPLSWPSYIYHSLWNSILHPRGWANAVPMLCFIHCKYYLVSLFFSSANIHSAISDMTDKGGGFLSASFRKRLTVCFNLSRVTGFRK